MKQPQETSGTIGPETPTGEVIPATSGPVAGNPFFNQEMADKMGLGQDYEVYKPMIDKMSDIVANEAVQRTVSPDNIKRNYIQRKQLIFQNS